MKINLKKFSKNKEFIKSKFSKFYFYLTIFEAVNINLVGFFTLLLQKRLFNNYVKVNNTQNPTSLEETGSYGLYWLTYNPNNEQVNLMYQMIAGWLFIAGVYKY